MFDWGVVSGWKGASGLVGIRGLVGRARLACCTEFVVGGGFLMFLGPDEPRGMENLSLTPLLST